MLAFLRTCHEQVFLDRQKLELATAKTCGMIITRGSIAPPPLLNWSIIVNMPAAHLPTMGGPIQVHAARPTCMADSKKNHAHLQVLGIFHMAQ